MKFFQPPFTDEHIKEQFTELSKILHPDKGGDEEMFKLLVKERDLLLRLREYYKGKSIQDKQVRRKFKPQTQPKKINFIFDASKSVELIKQLRKIIKGQ